MIRIPWVVRRAIGVLSTALLPVWLCFLDMGWLYLEVSTTTVCGSEWYASYHQ